MVPNVSDGVVASPPARLFEDRVGLGTSWTLEGVGLGGSDGVRLGRQALVGALDGCRMPFLVKEKVRLLGQCPGGLLNIKTYIACMVTAAVGEI